MASATESALYGQVAIVTGSGGGIGAAIAGRLARMGALTFLCGRRRTPLEGTAEAILKSGGKAEIAECDVTDLSSIEALAALVDQHGVKLRTFPRSLIAAIALIVAGLLRAAEEL